MLVLTQFEVGGHREGTGHLEITGSVVEFGELGESFISVSGLGGGGRLSFYCDGGGSGVYC